MVLRPSSDELDACANKVCMPRRSGRGRNHLSFNEFPRKFDEPGKLGRYVSSTRRGAGTSLTQSRNIFQRTINISTRAKI